MNIHEYQAKQLLASHGVPTPRSAVILHPAAAYAAAQELGPTVAVKAQIHAGGRGKVGGVRIAHSPEEAEAAARDLLGSTLVTHQTGPEGKVVHQVLIEEGLDIAAEYYLGIVIDRAIRRPVFMVSSEGGVEIEEVAATQPEKILKEAVDPTLGLQGYQARRLAFGLGLQGQAAKQAPRFMAALWEAFSSSDASLAEINPLVVTGDDRLIALDAKMNFDSNALYRHPNLRALRDYSEEEPLEIRASRSGLNYIKLDGNVGCMVNGAGLAMATMDIIKLFGGSPANFLDVGGGASVDQVRAAFKILVSDPNVRAVLINIFGGIMRCDVVAQGVVQAVRDVGVEIPVVVRLEGTNVEQGRQILEEAQLGFEVAVGMADAAEKVCARA